MTPEEQVVYSEPVPKGAGSTMPRLWTRPLRDLTPDTSLGFEVIDYAREVLHIELRPWQKWLLIHALELVDDGSYRFQVVVVLVARQNGKTTLASVLASWWLFVDAVRHPDRVPPVKFKIVGTAQNLDIAREPWAQVKLWCDPAPKDDESRELAIPELQAATVQVRDTNGDQYIKAASLARYEIRAADNARGKPAARVLMDELREQRNFVAWDAVSETTKSFWSGQLWALSNAGSATSVVLSKQRDTALENIASWADGVESGMMTPEDWYEEQDSGTALFEWSAPDGCAIDDEAGILQANPSCGYGGMTLRKLRNGAKGKTEAGYRTETLCQWVKAEIDPYLEQDAWAACADDSSEIPEGARTVLAVDVSADRKTAWVAVAGLREDGLPHVETIARRDGVMWVVPYLRKVRERWPECKEVALQTKGCASADLADAISEAGFRLRAVEGRWLGMVAGRFRDRVGSRSLRHPVQPAIDRQARYAVTKRLGENDAWSRTQSAVQISGLVAMSEALLALDLMGEPEEAAPSGSPYPFTVI